MSMDVLCIGHAAYDISVFVDGYPSEDSKSESDESWEACGGPAANAAYLLSKWGAKCAFAGLVGDDHYGRRIRDDFLSVGTDVSLLELRPLHATPLSIILVNRHNGSRTIVNRKLNREGLQPDTKGFDRDRLGDFSPRFLLFDGHEPEASLASLTAFPTAISILDAGSWREGTAMLAGKVDYLAASERFALQATGLSDLRGEQDRRDCATRLRRQFATTVIVTLGEHGLIAEDDNGFQQFPAFPVQTIDSTAAGDIFHGAFLFGIARSMPFSQSLRFASMTAALSVQSRGGRSSIPQLDQVTKAFADAD